jgi:hypothetical protein
MRSVIRTFSNKCLSLSYLGDDWNNNLIQSNIEAGRTISYVQTLNPRRADKFHQSIKESDKRVFMREFERVVRFAIARLGLKNRRVRIGFDTTEDLTWCKSNHYNLRPSVYDRPLEAWHFLNVAVIEPYYLPLMSIPYSRLTNLDDLVIDLLNYVKTLPIIVDLILFDRGFYHAYLIDYLEGKKRGWSWPYLILVQERKLQTKLIQQTRDANVTFASYNHVFNYKKDKSSWKPSTTLMVRIIDEKTAWCYATNQRPSLSLCMKYPKRWTLETGFRVHDEARIKSKSLNPKIRFFYHLVGMLLIILWRLQNKDCIIVFKRFLKMIEYEFYNEEIKRVLHPP